VDRRTGGFSDFFKWKLRQFDVMSDSCVYDRKKKGLKQHFRKTTEIEMKQKVPSHKE